MLNERALDLNVHLEGHETLDLPWDIVFYHIILSYVHIVTEAYVPKNAEQFTFFVKKHYIIEYVQNSQKETQLNVILY